MKNPTDRYRDKWFETYYSILYRPPGEYPQTKGPWTDTDYVAESIAFMKQQEPAGTVFFVLESRSGHIDAQDADEWLQMRSAFFECAKEEEAYIKEGICATCGSCNAREAKKKCRPSRIGDSGDYSCDGERLWEGGHS